MLDRTNGKPVWPIEERAGSAINRAGRADVTRRSRFRRSRRAFERQGFTEDDVVDFTPEIKQRALEIARRYQLGPLFTPPSEKGTIVLPGHGGGANYGGASFDPDTGMLYVPSVTIPIGVKAIAGDPARGNLAYRHAPALGLPSIDGLLLVKPPYARITAYDLNKGDIAWQVPLGDGPRNHPLLKDLNVGPLGSDGKGHPLLTKSLLFVSLSRPGRARR